MSAPAQGLRFRGAPVVNAINLPPPVEGAGGIHREFRVAFFAIVVVVLAGLGVLWWLAGRRRAPSHSAARHAVPVRVDRTAHRASAEFSPPPTGISPDGQPDASVGHSAAPPPEVQLLNDDTLTPQVALALTALADSIPRPRSVMLQLLQAGDDPVEVARVVSTDPATAALLLRTVNSAQFGLAREITSVQHAITYLGANLVRDVATHHAMAIPVDTRNLAAERIYQGLWRDSYLASGIAQALAQRFGWPSPSVLSTQALLFRLGDVALVLHQPELAALYSADPDLSVLVDQTQQALGFNAAMAGTHLAQVWGLPRAIGEVLRGSLAPLVGGPLDDEQRLGVTVGYFSTRLAQALSRQVDFDLPAALGALMERAEAHYLPRYLAAINLPDPLLALAEPAVERRLAGLVARR